MPFKLKLKKSRQYNVTSKSLFVISVHHLLDTSMTVDCTLSSESTGQECLNNVCGRLSINQPEFFGLRYIVKGTDDDLRWIDLERPLNRQLEKFAANQKLYLKLMYYVISGVSLINDEVTRNYYFLQLKNDVVENRIHCDPKQAVILAIYCRQAEYDSHQKDKHTVDYLKTLLPFPKHLIEAGLLEQLTEEVLQQNAELNNLPQSAAEELYIGTCQQLNGYGQEKFTAKDDSGDEVSLGITIAGIYVSGEMCKFYPWRDISNVVNHKRTFNIECTSPEKTVGFTLSDAETGRYVWKLCVLQHTFFMKYEQNQAQTSQLNLNLFQNINDNLTDSRDNLLIDNSQNNLNLLQQPNWHASDSHISTISNWTESPTINTTSVNSLQQSQNPLMEQNWKASSIKDYSNHNSNWGVGPAGSNASLNNRAQSSSCLDLSHNNNISNNNINQDRERLKSLVPTYRPAPDYEVAVQQKYRELRLNTPLMQLPSTVVSDPHINIYSGSQPDVRRSGTISDPFGKQMHYPDVTQITNSSFTQQHIDASMYGGVDGLTQRFRMMRLTKPPPPYPANRLSSTSTPDLALASHRALIGYRGAYVSGSSPDLVSSRTFVNASQSHVHINNPSVYYTPTSSSTLRLRHSQSYLPHGTYDHLNEQQQLQPPPKTNLLSRQIQKVYDGGNVIYCMPRDVEQILLQEKTSHYPNNGKTNTVDVIHSIVNNNSSQHINGSIEPIYENVPLAWQNETNNNPNSNNSEMRDRTSSIQSAPGVMRYGDKSKATLPTTILNEEQHVTVVNIGNYSNNKNDHNNSNSHNNINSNHVMNSGKVQLSEQARELLNEKTHRILAKTISNPIITQTHDTSTININNNNVNNNISYAENISSSTNNLTYLNEQKTVDVVLKNHQNNNISSNNNNNNNINNNITMNLSKSTSNILLDTSHNSINTTSDSGISTLSNNTNNKEKRKKRWAGLLSRGRIGIGGDKQKSATLGREKEKNKKDAISLTREEDLNLKHRWSTGLPRVQPLPANVSKETLCQMLEAKLANAQLYKEFETIPRRKDNGSYICALHDENKKLNFDPNFLPYDDNRIRLTPTRDNRMGYVNASLITATVGAKQRFYIVGQSPRDVHSSHIFWQSVWEADVYLLVQLSDEINYVPANSDGYLEYGQYQVWREFSQESDRCVTSKLRVYHVQSRRYRSVWHLNYSEWGEQNTPRDVSHFLDFLEELNSVRSQSTNEVPPGHNTNPPVLIHCSEGGGRAGVTLAADLLLYTLDHNQDLDIPRVVAQLRYQRGNIVPSLAQYKFIYALLIHYLKRTRLI